MPAFKRPSAPSAIETRPSNTAAGDKNKPASETTRPVQSPPLSPVPVGQYAREDRAAEHDRQKYFKALDRARTKARKAFGMEAAATKVADSSPVVVVDEKAGTIGRKGTGPRKHHGAQERSVSVGDEKEFWRVPGDLGLDQIVIPARKTEVVSVGMPQVEVKLVDLVQTSTRKPGKKGGNGGGLGGDYEVIPHVRSVIVLDGELEGKPKEMDLEDAWEYIGGEDEVEMGKQKPTYATIAAAGMAV